MREQEPAYLRHRYAQRLILREPVCAGSDKRKCYGFASQLRCQFQRSAVTLSHSLPLSKPAAAPCRSYRMDYIFCMQVKCRRPGRLSRKDLTDLFSGFKKLIPACSFIDRLINTSADPNRGIRRVDYSIRLYIYYIVAYYLQCHFFSPML